MDGCHGGDPAASNRDPFKGTRGYLRVRWLKFGTAIQLKYLGLCMRPWVPLLGSPYSHISIYSESRLVVDGSK